MSQRVACIDNLSHDAFEEYVKLTQQCMNKIKYKNCYHEG